MLGNLGDSAMNVGQYDEAISLYTIILSLNLPTLQDLLGKRSRALAATGMWKDALNDANEVARIRFVMFRAY